MEIKQATLSEFVEVLFLVRECIKDMNNKGFRQWDQFNPSPEQLTDDLEKGSIYLIKDHGIAKGMMKLTNTQPAEFADVNWKKNLEKPLYLMLFAVHPLWQNKEVGEQMIEFAEIFAKENGFSGIRIDALTEYPFTNDFFESKQFMLADTYHNDPQKNPNVCYEKSL